MAQKKNEKGRKKEGSSKEEETIKVTFEVPLHIAETALKMGHDIFGVVASLKKKTKEK